MAGNETPKKRRNPRREKREALIDARLFEANVELGRALEAMKHGTNTLTSAAVRNLDAIRWKVNRIRDLAANKL